VLRIIVPDAPDGPPGRAGATVNTMIEARATVRCMLVGVLILAVGRPAGAQEVSSDTLSLARIFSSADFSSERFGPARWLVDGSGYTTLERSRTLVGGTDIVRYDPESGRREILVSAEQLIPSGGSTPLAVEDYSWSPDGSKSIIMTNSRRVWRRNTRGDFWVLDLASGALRQLGGDAAPSTLMFAKVSPDGTMAAYVRENNLYAERLSDGRITPLTTDGSRTIINGTFDWVYEEEFDLRDGFRWSPDSRRIAYWQLDAEGVGEFYLINDTDSIYSRVIPLQYPKAGTTNSASRIGVVTVDTGETVWIRDEDDHRNHYPARMDWANNADELIIQHLNRLQNRNDVMIAEAATGQARVVMTDRDDAWLDVVDDLLWTADGRYFTWVSESDGWRHAYLVDRESGDMRLITDGAYDVQNIVRIDMAGGWLYFTGSLENATELYLYRVSLDGGAPERLTPADLTGWNEYQLSHDARWAIHTVSDFETPPIVDLVSLPDHRVRRTLVENRRLKDTVSALDTGESSFFQVDIGDGVTLDGWMIKPSDFDASKKYPVLFHVYGEPAGTTVNNRWGSSRMLWHHFIAGLGYVVISIDNRGTPGPHGRAWRKSIYGEIGTLAAHDQAAALMQIREWPFIDPSRIGIWGWSGGGSMTLNMMFRYPDLYHTGMSVAPVPDQRLYDTIYQERYMGLPQENAEGYRDGSPITYAEHLKGNLLVVHGSGDDNVHYQGTERLVNRLIELNKPFDTTVYPNRSHGIYEGVNTTRHLHELLTRYLLEHLPAGGRE